MVVIYNLMGWVVLKIRLARTLMTPHCIPLVNNLEILEVFKDEDKEEGDGVTDALSTML